MKSFRLILVLLSVVCLIASSCQKDNPENGGDEPITPITQDTTEIVNPISTSEVQYHGQIFIEARYEDETKLYFQITSPDEVALVSGLYYYQDNPSLAYIYRGEVVIPSAITHLGTTYSVTAIGGKAFAGSLVTSVVMPNSITSILSVNAGYMRYDGAFANCSSLESIRMSENIEYIGPWAFNGCLCYEESVTIPNSVKRIGMGAFLSKIVYFNAENCTVAGERYDVGGSGVYQYYSAFPFATTIVFGDNVKTLPGFIFARQNLTVFDVPSSITTVSSYAFSGCNYLERINSFENIQHIEPNAFFGCESHITISLNSSLTKIDDGAFNYFAGLEMIDIPNSVITIGDNAFSSSGLHSINWGNSVDTIGSSAFASCKNLNEVEIPNTVSYIGQRAFQYCDYLVSLTVGNNVRTIGPEAFLYCPQLESVDFGNAVERIGEEAFNDCQHLYNINLPSSVKFIDNKAFDGYHYGTEITCLAVEPPVLGENVFGDRFMSYIHVPVASVEAYKNAPGWSEYADKIVGI